jgi:glycerol-3-phosphate dehydrogenase
MGLCFGSNLYQFEVEHLIKQEWAQTAEDVLCRRTNMGLRLNSVETEALQIWMTDQPNKELSNDKEE